MTELNFYKTQYFCTKLGKKFKNMYMNMHRYKLISAFFKFKVIHKKGINLNCQNSVFNIFNVFNLPTEHSEKNIGFVFGLGVLNYHLL